MNVAITQSTLLNSIGVRLSPGTRTRKLLDRFLLVLALVLPCL
jgi:hypothetical protein